MSTDTRPMPALISVHLLRVFEFVRSADSWVTAGEIADRTGMAARTARHHARTLLDRGVCHRARVHPGHRYRYDADGGDREFLDRLEEARAALPPVNLD